MNNIRIEKEKESFKTEYKRIYKALTNAKVPANKMNLVLNELMFINETNKATALEALHELIEESESFTEADNFFEFGRHL